METKKDIKNYCNNINYYFNKMFKLGGKYKELEAKKSFKIIKIIFSNKMTVVFPMTEEEYIFWRSIKPSIKEGDSIKSE